MQPCRDPFFTPTQIAVLLLSVFVFPLASILPLLYLKNTPDIITVFPVALASGYDAYYWGANDNCGLSFGDVSGGKMGGRTTGVNFCHPHPNVHLVKNLFLGLFLLPLVLDHQGQGGGFLLVFDNRGGDGGGFTLLYLLPLLDHPILIYSNITIE